MPKKLIFALLATALVPAGNLAAAPAKGTLAIVDATIFDGTGAAPQRGTVVVTDGRIVAVGADVKAPRGAKVVNAKGKALIPGLFDVHSHWTPAGDPAALPHVATAYVKAGITTVTDFHQQPEAYAPRRAWLESITAPHVSFAARVSTPGGHGADWADQATTIWISTPEGAKAAINGLIPYKPDFIKAFTDGWRYGVMPDNTSMDRWTLTALSEAAGKQGWPVLTHTVTVERGLAAAGSKITALAHGLQDRPITAAEAVEISKTGVALAPTLAVYDPDKSGPPADPQNPRYVQSVTKFGYALQNVKALSDAGVTIALGTDAGMPNTPHGVSTLKELELLVRAGLTPAQALVAGTLNSAKVLRLDDDRGTIAAGKRADMVLIDGKPWEQIRDVYKISQVYIDGRLVSGQGAPALPAGNKADRLPSVTVPALVDDFERADFRSSLDTLRLEMNDGGHDRTVQITQVVDRPEGGKALLLSARMAVKQDPYAGFAIPLTRGSVTPVKLTGYKGVRFDIKGQGDYQIRLNGMDGIWQAPVQGKDGWQTVEVPFTSLTPVESRGKTSPAFNGDGIVQVEFGGSRKGGERLWLQIDNVTFY